MAKFINDALALKAFRHSDFDVYSAYGEVVDNSIQANAKWVKIKIDSRAKTSQTNPYYIINEAVFSDNGIGMSKETLSNCLSMGYSTRYDDRKGIGRFGVGMTLASINQCKRVDVYSREKDGEWFWTYIDLDEIIIGICQKSPKQLKKSHLKSTKNYYLRIQEHLSFGQSMTGNLKMLKKLKMNYIYGLAEPIDILYGIM